MAAESGVEGVFCEVPAHSLAVAARPDDGRAFASSRADGAENIGRGGALVLTR